MSKRSAFWQPFTTRTPLGYSIAGHFNTEPGPRYGTLRFTHVDGLLSKAYQTLPAPELPLLRLSPGGAVLPKVETLVDVRAVERPDGTLIAFYPLYDASGALVEVVPRTRDTVVVADTPWRPLATLVGRVRHAGIEEAVRRQRAIFVFILAGSANQRLVPYPYEARLMLHSVVRSGRNMASHAQMRGWATHYGLDLAPTIVELGAMQHGEVLAARVAEVAQSGDARNTVAEPGAFENGGATFWFSERTGATLLEWPGHAADDASGTLDAATIWREMARLADQSLTPTAEATALALAQQFPDSAPEALTASFLPAWERWVRAYPEAFPDAEVVRMAV